MKFDIRILTQTLENNNGWSRGKFFLVIGNKEILNKKDGDFCFPTSAFELLESCLNGYDSSDVDKKNYQIINCCGGACPICVTWDVEKLKHIYIIKNIIKVPKVDGVEIKYDISISLKRGEYIKTVIKFVDGVKDFYKQCPKNEFVINSDYKKFWKKFNKNIEKCKLL